MSDPSSRQRPGSLRESAPGPSLIEAPAFAAATLGLRTLLLFALVTLIWGSTWIVIRDQLGSVPPAWSVTYRFVIAAAAMFAWAAWRGESLRIGRRGHALAIAFGLPQFFVNFNFVYWAEHYVTSGLVAVVFAMLLVPNSAFARLFLKQPVTRRFLLGSAIAMAGVALLFAQEIRQSPAGPRDVLIGIGLTVVGVLGASTANILQATAAMRERPLAAMLAWGMSYGVLADGLAAFLLFGPPVFEARPAYWIGLVYLGLLASALAFTVYFGIVRRIGPARAAYSSVVVPVIAMALSTIFEGYRWSALAASGGVLALAGLVIALRSRAPPRAGEVERVKGIEPSS